ncbi:hypothetical protein TRIUR3_34135 [Triticum urartu]|uniref:Uncharacterized protein n=1 Tax=Triticum urartu TaxID=4572 RepID=M7ZPZ9_TRIUA|nr:hypothetical protein TRIUR3_34135 [Triticum urartu]
MGVRIWAVASLGDRWTEKIDSGGAMIDGRSCCVREELDRDGRVREEEKGEGHGGARLAWARVARDRRQEDLAGRRRGSGAAGDGSGGTDELRDELLCVDAAAAAARAVWRFEVVFEPFDLRSSGNAAAACKCEWSESVQRRQRGEPATMNGSDFLKNDGNRVFMQCE